MLATDAYLITLRIVHIATGVLWVGSFVVVVVFVQPSAAALGPSGAPFMSELRRRRFVDVVFVDAVFTVLAGAFLYWHDWHLQPSFSDWIGSSFGTWLTVGALLAISGLGVAARSSRAPRSADSSPSGSRSPSRGRPARAPDGCSDRHAPAPARRRRAGELLGVPARGCCDGHRRGTCEMSWPDPARHVELDRPDAGQGRRFTHPTRKFVRSPSALLRLAVPARGGRLHHHHPPSENNSVLWIERTPPTSSRSTSRRTRS